MLAAAGFGAIRLSLFNTDVAAWYEVFRIKECILFAVVFALIVKFRLHPVAYIALAGAAGVALGL